MVSFYAENHIRHISKLEERFGAVSDEVAVALRTLVRLICREEDPVDAIPFLERLNSIRQSLAEPQSILADLDAWINATAGVDFKLVEPFQLRRLAVKVQIFGEPSQQVADECGYLAHNYACNSDYPNAKAFFERSIANKEKVYGAFSTKVIETIDKFADASSRLKEWEEAERNLVRSLDLNNSIYGESSKEAAKVSLMLAALHANASTFQRRGEKISRIRKAETFFSHGLRILEDNFGPDDCQVQSALREMARVYLDCGHFYRAEPLLRRLLSTCEKLYGDDAAALLWILIELSHGYAHERSTEAEPMMERSFDILRKFLDVKRPILRSKIGELPASKAVLFVGIGEGLLEKLVRVSEVVRRNTRIRWGASG